MSRAALPEAPRPRTNVGGESTLGILPRIRPGSELRAAFERSNLSGDAGKLDALRSGYAVAFFGVKSGAPFLAAWFQEENAARAFAGRVWEIFDLSR